MNMFFMFLSGGLLVASVWSLEKRELQYAGSLLIISVLAFIKAFV